MSSTITVVALGLTREQLTLGALDTLKSAQCVILRTRECGARAYLDEAGVAYTALDDLYETAPDFDALSDALAGRVLDAAEHAPVAYGVLDLRDESVDRLIRQAPDRVRVIPGVPVDAPLSAYTTGAVAQVAASDIQSFQPESANATCVREIASQTLAGEVKLRLLERYPAQTRVYFTDDGETVSQFALTELDRQNHYDHKSAALVLPEQDLLRLTRYGFDELNRIIRILRAPGGCPWDRKQTHETIRANMIEEACEAVDAINAGDTDALYDELGDVLLQVALHAEIGRVHGEFTVDDVTTAICHKLIARHQHVFGTAVADTPDAVLALWDSIKQQERKQTTQTEAMRGIAKSLPSLMRASKIQKKATNVGFNWPDAQGAFSKIYEEADELRDALATDTGFEEELGDLLFSIVNVAMLHKTDAEVALARANDKFVRRFAQMEEQILADGKALADMTLEEMDTYWDRVKSEERA